MIQKMSKLTYNHADVSRKVKTRKISLFFKMTVSFDLNKLFQFCLDILKDKCHIITARKMTQLIFFENSKVLMVTS